jgi:aminoglycoside phosphotransferase (APT) family kinase protein
MRQMPTAQPGFWRRNEVLSAYLRLSSRAVGDFTFYRVLSLFRSAVVFLQLYDRFRRSPGQHMRYAEFDTLGRELIDHAFELIRGRAE